MEYIMNQTKVSAKLEPRVAALPQEERFIRLNEVLAICGKSRTSIYEAIKAGKFPAPVKLQGRSSAWVKSEIQQWIQACITASRAK
jgi:prophage regulatory protein